MPNKKVGAGALAGAFAWLVVWAGKQFGGLEVGAEGGIAFSTIFTFIIQYLVPNAPE